MGCCLIEEAGNRDFRLCCILVPHPNRLYSPARCQSTRIHCAFGPHLCLGLPQGTVTGTPFASDYSSRYLSRDRTCSLKRTKPPVTLDANLELGTLAERTGKQPGHARHTTTKSTLLSHTRQKVISSVLQDKRGDKYLNRLTFCSTLPSSLSNQLRGGLKETNQTDSKPVAMSAIVRLLTCV